MFGSFDFCLPTLGIKVPDRPEWIHEVKYDGYRLRIERDGERVRLITRGGYNWIASDYAYNWTKRYLWIVEALKNRHKQFVIDGEAVILGVDGISNFNVHSAKSNREVQLYAFDVLAMDGDDLRALPLWPPLIGYRCLSDEARTRRPRRRGWQNAEAARSLPVTGCGDDRQEHTRR
jgi:bifunctional non-homologous end joining protein LigD